MPVTNYRILLIKPSALGDIMHSLPVLTALRRLYPRASIAWLVNRVYQPLLAGHPDLDETIPFDRGMVRTGVVSGTFWFLRFLRSLRREPFDMVIDLQGLLRSGLMTFATRARRRIGLASAREGARWFYTEVVDDTSAMHAVERYWKVIEALGSGAQEKRFVLPVAPDAAHWAHSELADCPRPWLALAVGSRWRTKRWPPEHFAALAQRALDRFGGAVILVGTPDETAVSQATARLIHGPVRDFTGRTTLPQVAALLHAADVTLANDTGPLHLAVALGRPVLAPYTCTKIELTGPYGQTERAVATRVWCAGSLIRQCDRLDCMRELTPDRLWPILDEMLQTWPRRLQSA